MVSLRSKRRQKMFMEKRMRDEPLPEQSIIEARFTRVAAVVPDLTDRHLTNQQKIMLLCQLLVRSTDFELIEDTMAVIETAVKDMAPADYAAQRVQLTEPAVLSQLYNSLHCAPA